MNTLTARRVTAAVAALSLAATPAVATASTHATRSQAEKHCRALLKREGRRKFDKKYGPKNAMGKCVSAYLKTHK